MNGAAPFFVGTERGIPPPRASKSEAISPARTMPLFGRRVVLAVAASGGAACGPDETVSADGAHAGGTATSVSPRNAAATLAPIARATSCPIPAATGARKGRAGILTVPISCGTAAGSLLPTTACNPSASMPTLSRNAPLRSQGSSCLAAPDGSDKPSRTLAAMRAACSASARAITSSGRRRSRCSRSSFSPEIFEPIRRLPIHSQMFSICSKRYASGNETFSGWPFKSSV